MCRRVVLERCLGQQTHASFDRCAKSVLCCSNCVLCCTVWQEVCAWSCVFGMQDLCISCVFVNEAEVRFSVRVCAG